jgi:hypothetical protein
MDEINTRVAISDSVSDLTYLIAHYQNNAILHRRLINIRDRLSAVMSSSDHRRLELFPVPPKAKINKKQEQKNIE